MKRIAVIGSGNMGSAIVASLYSRECVQVVATARTQATLERLSREYEGIMTTTDNAAAVAGADIVVLAVKPYVAPEVFDQIRGNIKNGAVVVSVIAGLSVAEMREVLGNETLSCFRVIPNTAIKVGKSVTFISHDSSATPEDVDLVEGIFSCSGSVFEIAEKDMPVCTALASCGIAYFMRFIRALAEGSVEMGLRAGFATEIAALTAEGAAALLADGSHPEQEIDKVTTPGGITIRGLNALEEHGFTAAVIAAIKASSVK